MRNRFGQTIQLYLVEHRTLYLFTIVLFAMGIIFGTLIVNALAAEQKQELLSFLQYFFGSVSDQGIPETNQHFQQSFGQYLKTVAVMWVFGLSIIGLPVILLLLFLKGLIVGFTVGFLVNQLKWQGVTFSLAGVLPQNMLVVPALLIVGVAGISFSLRLIRTRLLTRQGQILPHFLSYTCISLAMLGVMTMAALFETFVSPHLMRYVLN
ncbi:stage II sporulation protein M [Brevibacillus humidisoli]|uniref:stage II sporulation protein M n=1 Tax=Brevibacillus humidisoli TaxID=2895522 RepID=UPI001E2D61C3|nr:stage II sporulation protein M [Brevibacillus humidisoli]UFJ42875.1 stage II sporulation protein M [Brevibacillus humidisoli]